MEMYWILNEGKLVAAENFIRIFNNKIYKYMISLSKNGYIYKLDGFVINTTMLIVA